MISICKLRFAPLLARSICMSPMYCANHYDALGITPKATQNDIKSAYYKLSKLHHPDKSKDEESAKKFRAIKEAYEVLGNTQLKKMYDKGLLVGQQNTSRMEYEPEPEPTDPTLRFYKSRDKRQVTTRMYGKTPIYDFDTWSKHHYGDLFQRSQYEKELVRNKSKRRTEHAESTKQENLIYLMFALGSLFIMLVVHGKSDYDMDSIKKKREEKARESKEN